MTRRRRRFASTIAAGGVLLQLAGCAPSLNDEVAAFLRDLSLEALVAFLF